MRDVGGVAIRSDDAVGGVSVWSKRFGEGGRGGRGGVKWTRVGVEWMKSGWWWEEEEKEDRGVAEEEGGTEANGSAKRKGIPGCELDCFERTDQDLGEKRVLVNSGA